MASRSARGITIFRDNCFIIRSRSLFFIIISESGKLREAIFQFLNKRVVSMRHEGNIICRKTQLGSITHEQTIICWQLYKSSWVLLSQPMKRKKKCIE